MSIEFPQHAVHPYFGVENDCLLIGGEPLTTLAQRIGRTPFYAYDRRVVLQRIEELRALLPRDVDLHYAIKANPMPDLVRLIAGRVDGLDVASARELEVALGAGGNPRDISFAGPGKTDAELAAAAAAGILINVESDREIQALARIGGTSGRKPRIAIRVNPDFELKSSGMKMGGGPKQFGIDAERVPEVLATLGGLPLAFEGFHIFSGSQNLRSESIIEAERKSVELAIRLAQHAPAPARVVNIGGGFGIPYFPGENRLDTQPIGAALRELVATAKAALPEARLVIELGRYIVGEAGIYVCRVVDRKISRGQVFLVTDGGLHHHLAASGNFGQVIRKNYPVLVGNRVRGAKRETASVVGPLCTPLDLLADRYEMAVAAPGDLIVVFQSGAYGLTASPLGFLSHPHPAEVLVG
jgi:diaminopimelate decarboxylase